MANKFKGLTRVFFYIAALVYPVLVFYFLVIRKTPIRVLSLFVVAFALSVFFMNTSKKKVIESLAAHSGLLFSFSV